LFHARCGRATIATALNERSHAVRHIPMRLTIQPPLPISNGPGRFTIFHVLSRTGFLAFLTDD
jgi:hypothetical protein